MFGIILFLALSSVLSPQDTSNKEKMMKDAAEAWLRPVDAGDYGKAYDELAGTVKKEIKRDDFVKSTDSLRKFLGKLQMRKLKSVEFVTNPPGPPEGEYSAVQYNTSFENRTVIEAIAFRLEDGKWGVIGYFVQ
jgi:hypothetical protein